MPGGLIHLVTNEPLSPLAEGATSNVSVFGSMIDVDLQTQLLFRIVTRDPDTTGTLNPINIY